MGSRLGYDRKSAVSSYSRWPELAARRAISRPNSQVSSAAASSSARLGRSSRPPASSSSLGQGEPGRVDWPFESPPTSHGDSPTAPGWSSSPRFAMAPSWRTPWSRRSAAASGAFALTTENQAAIVGLCRRLDGLPLAIELAAVRTRALAAEQILERLSDRFALLTGGSRVALPRHQTLETTIDWSYELLGNGEQALLRRLCVFAGRFTLEDVEAVCTSDNLPAAEALDTMTSLVDKSLVTKEDVRSLACYRLHETMREYATLKLRGAHEERVLEERCLEYYRATCLQSVDQARYRLVKWLAWADLEIDNIRAVLHQCVARGDLARGLDIAASMGYYWVTHGTTESTWWLDQLLGAEDAGPATKVRAYYLRGWLSLLQADAATARPWIARAVTTARETRQLTKLSESLSI